MIHPNYTFQGEHEILMDKNGKATEFVGYSPYASRILAITLGTGNAVDVLQENNGEGIVNISEASTPIVGNYLQNEYVEMGREGGLNGMLAISTYAGRSYMSVLNNALGKNKYAVVEPETMRNKIYRLIDDQFIGGLGMLKKYENNPFREERKDNSIYGMAAPSEDSLDGLYKAVNDIYALEYTPIILTSNVNLLKLPSLQGTSNPGVFSLGTNDAQIVEAPAVGKRASFNKSNTKIAPYIVFAKELLFSAYINNFKTDFTPASFDPREILTNNDTGKSETGVSGWTNLKDAVRTYTFFDAGYFQPEGVQTAFTNLKVEETEEKPETPKKSRNVKDVTPKEGA